MKANTTKRIKALVRDGQIFTVGTLTRDENKMPKPDDEDFRPKLDEYFRREMRELLSMNAEDLAPRNLFTELERVLEQRTKVIEEHDDYLSAKSKVNRHAKTGDGKEGMMPTRIIGSGSTPVAPQVVSDTNRAFWKQQGESSAPDATRKGTADAIADINERNRQFWGQHR